MNTQFKKGVLDLCVLNQLVREDRYGYELTELISKELEVTAGTLYLILKRIKDDGYVTTYLQESDSGPARKYYHLTEKGRDYLQKQKAEWLEFLEKAGKLLA
ncbi:MAG: PadR family transcriptional regulator [Erysipelotrichaceae bacterium]|nr:PadR family transcriptional regulator [Erysipelotrichaceae bacterium]